VLLDGTETLSLESLSLQPIAGDRSHR